MKNSWYIYILECRDGSFYTGVTNNLEKRQEKHNQGKASRYTRARLPVKLLYSEKFRSRAAAQKRECALKSLNRKEKEKLIYAFSTSVA